MKIAATYENGTIFQHFGHSEAFKVYEAEGGKVISAQIVTADGGGHGALVDLLSDLGVEALICGGIGGGAIRALDAAGIHAYPGVVGSADAAVESLLAGTLAFNPDTLCDHHAQEGGHDCGEHTCHR